MSEPALHGRRALRGARVRGGVRQPLSHLDAVHSGKFDDHIDVIHVDNEVISTLFTLVSLDIDVIHADTNLELRWSSTNHF